MLNGLDLFSGIGGIALALAPWVEPIAYCEIERFPQSVLLSQMAEGNLPIAPIWTDVTTLNRKTLGAIPVDIITGGFPCQDISIAGARKGLAGERSGLFFEIERLCRELRPRFIFLENVPAITTLGGREVVGAITALGYDCRWCIISAASVGNFHLRKRWFLLAHDNNKRPSKQQSQGKKQQGRFRPYRVPVQKVQPPGDPSEIFLCRGDDAIPFRVDSIKCCGNAVDWLQARTAFEILLGI